MSKIKVNLIDRMGNDLTVVNTARVSFGKESYELSVSDRRLIKYLAKHGHWSPFAHVQLSFRIKAPVFVARQLGKHQVGLTWNEISRRYVDTDIEFYRPTEWRKAADNVKQGSSADPIDNDGLMRERYANVLAYLRAVYEVTLADGVCQEQARMLLPQSLMTEWIWTGSLVAFARIVQQRTHETAQRETKEVAMLIKNTIDSLAELKYSWNSLLDKD